MLTDGRVEKVETIFQSQPTQLGEQLRIGAGGAQEQKTIIGVIAGIDIERIATAETKEALPSLRKLFDDPE